MKTALYNLNTFVEVLSSVPLSKNGDNITFKPNKLLKLLFENEIKRFDFKPAQRILANELIEEYYTQLRLINSKAYNEDTLKQLLAVDIKADTTLPDILKQYVRQTGQSIKALYYHKTGNAQKAFEETLLCIAFNDYLLDKGIYSQLIRSIEQNINISRVFSSEEKFDKSYYLWKGIFEYLFIGSTSLLYGNSFQNEKCNKATFINLEAHLVEYTNLFAYYMMKRANYSYVEGKRFYELVLEPVLQHIKINSCDRLAIYNWIELQQLFYSNNYEQFLDYIPEYFSTHQLVLYDTLKLALLYQVRSIYVNILGQEFNAGLISLKDFIDHKLNVPQFIKDMVTER
jgi:hypothetical protein